MGLTISEISVENLGPIVKFSMKPGRINLVYGKNEKGKTFLVEFIISSLFRNLKEWRLRKEKGNGKVWVQGLNHDSVAFSPTSSRKLEDYLEDDSVGLPPDFSRLLIVKGAECEITDTRKTTDKAIIKRFLTGQDLLDRLTDKVKKTVQEAEIKDGIISGKKMGLIADREGAEEELKRIDNLFKRINEEYSSGKWKVLIDQKEDIDKQLGNLKKAREYTAFCLSEEIKELQKSKNQIDESRLTHARQELNLCNRKIEEIKRRNKEFLKEQENSRHYVWLKNAKKVYEKLLTGTSVKSFFWFALLSLISSVGVLIFLFLNIPAGVIAALILVLLFGFLYIKSLKGRAEKSLMAKELTGLGKEFKERFNKRLTGLPLLEELLEEQSKAYNRASLFKDQIFQENRDLEIMKLSIVDKIFTMTGKREKIGYAGDVISKLEIQIRELMTVIQDKREVLASLKVEPAAYVKDDPGMPYSDKVYKSLQEELQRITREIDSETQKLDSLKQRISQQTGDDFSVRLEEMIQNLRQHREMKVEDYKQRTAEIIGRNAVCRVCQELQKDEDTKILEGLQSMEVLEPLKKITGRYERLSLQNEELIVSDRFHDFPLSELSTGAREQVYLALRIGFSTQIVKKDQLFLILDDAFQYSDWERRDYLMNVVFNLAKMGWQIIYFTMDDHIKKLFEKHGKKLGDQFKMFELEERQGPTRVPTQQQQTSLL